MPKMTIDISLCSPLCNWYLSFSPFFTKLHNIPRVIVIDLLYHWSRVANKYVCGFAVLRFVRSYMREIINYHVMDRINLFRNNIVIMYEPELEHEFCDAMTINTPTQPRVYIKKGVKVKISKICLTRLNMLISVPFVVSFSLVTLRGIKAHCGQKKCD